MALGKGEDRDLREPRDPLEAARPTFDGDAADVTADLRLNELRRQGLSARAKASEQAKRKRKQARKNRARSRKRRRR